MKKTFFFTLFLLVAVLLEGQTPRLVVPNEHFGPVNCAAFSPNGKMVLMGYGFAKTAKLWDISGRELATFSTTSGESRNALNCVAFSPNGKTVLTGYEDGWVILFDLSGKELRKINAPEPILSVAFSPDCKTILIGGFYYGASLWDLSGNELRRLQDGYKTVWSGAFSPDGETFLTGNSDSTATLWSLSGKVLRTFSGHAGKVGSVAFSPDGNTILTRDGTARLWNLSGRELKTFSEHAGVRSVALSPDGKTVLMGTGDNTAKILDLSGKELRSFRYESFTGSRVSFSPDGKTILIWGEKEANLWDLSGRRVTSFLGHVAPVKPASFSLDGKTIQMGSDKTAYLWGLSDRELKSINLEPDITSFSFSPDGKMILTTSGSPDSRDRYDGVLGKTVKLWDLSGKELQSFNHGKLVNSIAFSPDGKMVLIGGAEGASLWNINGNLLQIFGHSPVKFAAFSPDGKSILTGERSVVATIWDLSGRELLSIETVDEIHYGTFSPDGKTIMLGLRYGASLYDLSGKELGSYDIFGARFSPDGKTIMAISADLRSVILDYSGQVLYTFTGEAPIAFSNDGRHVLTGTFNTSKIYDLNSAKPLATLMVLDSTDWVVTTPSGLFDASPGAMRLMYFVVGLEVIELEQLKERYYEPGLLSKVLGFADEPLREVEGFDSVALYPEVRLHLDTLQNKLHIHLTPRNGGIGKVSVFVNGKEVLEEANPPKGFNRVRDTAMVIDLEQYARYFLADSLNDVSVRAYNAAGWLKSAPYSVTYRPVFAGAKGNDQDRGAAPARLDGAPNLFILSVGTANYAGTKLDLKFAGKDALDMADAFQQIGRQLFNNTPGKVISYILTTDNSAYPTPTKANIKQAFEAIKKEAKAADILLVYFSGHGIAKGDEFYYLTQDMSSFEVEIEGKNRTVSNTELTRWINDIPALKQVLILDACNSGKVVESFALSRGLNSSQIRALEQLKDRTGMFVLTGSAADKVSYEAGQFGQGLLTYSLLEGIKGEVPDKFGHVDIMKLFRYATDRVPELAKGIGGIQTPVPVGPLGRSFAIGISDSSVHISIASEKPVFIRNNFQDEERFDDGLGLTNALKDYLVDQTALGDANFIYVDVSEYEAAYSMKGLYRMSGNDVEVRGRLFKGKTPVGEAFTVKGKKDDVPALVEAVVEEVLGRVDGQ